ncbi:diguanylate cyclase domain-containing protein [Aliidiomarina sp.]|uniref:sensor domain-containing diguanylate cyclase n=1 Tax=Aliidiomarina sp. TaxID=1872439 RepID=UPI003A4E494D
MHTSEHDEYAFTQDRQLPGAELGWVKGFVVFFAWVILWRASFLLEYGPFASIWYPPAGLTFAAILLYGWRGIIPVVAASYVTAYWIDHMYGLNSEFIPWLFTATSSTMAHTFSYAIGALFLRQFITMNVIRSLPSIIFGFLVLGVITSLLAAFFGVQVQISSGSLSIFNLYEDWLMRWVGDMVGVLVLAPLFIALLSWKTPVYSAWIRHLRISTQPTPMYQYLIKLSVNLGMLYLFILVAWWFENTDAAFAVFFLVIPQMWIAYTENAFRAVLSLAIFSVSLALGVAWFGLAEVAMIYQFAICVIASTVYFGLAVPMLLAQSNTLQYQANTDHLTGVSNRRYFIETLEEELARSKQGKYPVALALFDIRKFRAINNAYGHEIGDKLLVKVANNIQIELRQSDLLGRFSGNAFILCLPSLNADSATRFVEHLGNQLRYITLEEFTEALNVRYATIEVAESESVDEALARLQQEISGAP